MENATKALLITAVILLIIIIIAIGLKILNSTSGGTNEAETLAYQMKVKIFNLQWTQYEGEKEKGTNVKELFEKVIANNQDEETMVHISFIYLNSSTNTGLGAYTEGLRLHYEYDKMVKAIGQLIERNINDTYKIKVKYDYSGLVRYVKVINLNK